MPTGSATNYLLNIYSCANKRLKSDNSEFIVHRSSFIVHHSSFIIHRSSFIIHHSSFIVHHSSFIVHHSSFAIPPTSWFSRLKVLRTFTLRGRSFILYSIRSKHPASGALASRSTPKISVFTLNSGSANPSAMDKESNL